MTIGYRGIATRIFDHAGYRKLSPHARLLFLTLKLNPGNNYANIFAIHPVVIQEETGLTPEEYAAAMTELEEPDKHGQSWIKYRAPIVWIVNGMRHEVWNVSTHNSQKHIENILRTLNTNELIDEFRKYYKIEKPGTVKKPAPSEGKKTKKTVPEIYWDKVVAAVGRYGGVSVRITPPQIMAAIQSIGGWAKLGAMSREDLDSQKTAFLDALDSIDRDSYIPDCLPAGTPGGDIQEIEIKA